MLKNIPIIFHNWLIEAYFSPYAQPVILVNLVFVGLNVRLLVLSGTLPGKIISEMLNIVFNALKKTMRYS